MPRFDDLDPHLKRAVRRSAKKEDPAAPAAIQMSLLDQIETPPVELLPAHHLDEETQDLSTEEEEPGAQFHRSLVRRPEYELAARAEVLLPFLQYLTPTRDDDSTRELYRVRLAALLSLTSGASVELNYQEVRQRLAWIRPAEEAGKTLKRMLKYHVLEDTGYGYDVTPWAKVALTWILQVSGDDDPQRLIGLQVSALEAGADAENEEEVMKASLNILLQELGQAIRFCEYAVKSRAPNLLLRALRQARSYREKLGRLTDQIEALVHAGYSRLQVQECLAVKERLIGQLTRIYNILAERQERGLDSFGNYLTSEDLVDFLMRQPSLDEVGRMGLSDCYVPKTAVVLDPAELWHRGQQAFGEEFAPPPVEYQDLVETPVDEGQAAQGSDLEAIRAEVAALLSQAPSFEQLWFEARSQGDAAPTPMEAVLRSGLLSSLYADGHEHRHRKGALVVDMQVEVEVTSCPPDSPYVAANDGKITRLDARGEKEVR